MPTVRGGNQTHQGGYQTDTQTQMQKTHSPDKARDDLQGPIAGDENEGPKSNQKSDHSHDKQMKKRQTDKMKRDRKTPIR